LPSDESGIAVIASIGTLRSVRIIRSLLNQLT
jgi:hypothetical protein